MRYLVVLTLMCVLAGCGGKPSEPAAAPSPQIVFLQRNGGLAATLDSVAVRRDGTVHMEKRYGGAGARFSDFRLTGAMLARVRAGLARAARGDKRSRGEGRSRGATYLVRFGGRSYTVFEGAVPAALRGLVAALDDVLDGLGRRPA
jgi:hypothetical protein